MNMGLFASHQTTHGRVRKYWSGAEGCDRNQFAYHPRSRETGRGAYELPRSEKYDNAALLDNSE